jgi:hypothetical protein
MSGSKKFIPLTDKGFDHLEIGIWGKLEAFGYYEQASNRLKELKNHKDLIIKKCGQSFLIGKIF